MLSFYFYPSLEKHSFFGLFYGLHQDQKLKHNFRAIFVKNQYKYYACVLIYFWLSGSLEYHDFLGGFTGFPL